MREFLLTIFVLSLFGLSPVIGQHTLTVVVPNVKSIKGNMMVCLVNEKSDYLKDCYTEAETKVTNTKNVTVFEELPQGKYAISIFHDKNEDKKLNTNFIGIPKEPYGFSNNPSAMFGPPSYEKCLFQIEGDQTVIIKL